MTKSLSYLLSISSGLFFALAWNSALPSFSLFLAFVPILFLMGNYTSSNLKVFNLSFLSFFIYHLGTVWWLSKSSLGGFLIIICLNSIAMAAVIWLSNRDFKQFGSSIGLISFLVNWLSFEYIHYRWELSWPFMNLGNWLGQMPEIIQWYEYTGVLGGTLWILMVNILLFIVLKCLLKKRILYSIFTSALIISIVLIPVLVSKNIYSNYKENATFKKVKIIQPNIDPYTEKYNHQLFKYQIISQVNQAITGDTSYIDCYIFPESSFPVYLNENSIKSDSLIQFIENKLIKNVRTNVLGGLYSINVINGDTTFYNTAFMLNSDIQLYHKSKLVIGVEKMPFQDYFGFLRNLNVDFGGFDSNLGVDKARKVFFSSDSSLKIAPVICYESVYGEFVSDFVIHGANLIAVITNDGWWGNSPGYRQHLMHSQIRAIETRRAVARAANTGLSCLINQKGTIVKQSNAWSKNTITGYISINSSITFYSKYGDYIGKISLASSLLILIFQLYLKLKTKIKHNRL